MSNDNDDPTIKMNRRRVLAGLGTIGVASAGAGAGTMALFSDEAESSGNTVQAGSLDLTTNGDNSKTTTINVSEVAPGESGRGSTRLRNTGNISGYLNFDLGELSNIENGVTAPETGAPGEDGPGGSGELGRAHAADGAHALDVRAGFDTDGNGSIDTVVLNSMNKDPRNNISGVTGIEYKPNEPIGTNGDAVDFVVEYDLPQEAGNAVQGDSVEFDITFELLQQASGSSVAITGDSRWASEQPWQPTTSEAHTGSGSWYTGSDAAKRHLYFASEFSSFHDLPSFTVDDIVDLSYWLKAPDVSGSSVYLTIYTKKENDGDDSGWYDSRLQALPGDATGSFQGGQWNEFGTSSSAQHQLRFYDHVGSVSKPTASNQPTLDELQGDDYDWGSNGGSHSYHDEEVLALSLQTASGDDDVDAYVDDIALELNSGETFTIDLEA